MRYLNPQRSDGQESALIVELRAAAGDARSGPCEADCLRALASDGLATALRIRYQLRPWLQPNGRIRVELLDPPTNAAIREQRRGELEIAARLAFPAFVKCSPHQSPPLAWSAMDRPQVSVMSDLIECRPARALRLVDEPRVTLSPVPAGSERLSEALVALSHLQIDCDLTVEISQQRLTDEETGVLQDAAQRLVAAAAAKRWAKSMMADAERALSELQAWLSAGHGTRVTYGLAWSLKAPSALAAEMASLMTFKTATLAPAGYRRRGVWGEETASQKLEHLGLLFGAFAAPPNGPTRGLGVPIDALCFGMLALPRVWDWYLGWREQRRGFFTAWEVDMLGIVAGLTNAETGWITQTSGLADRLRPIGGLIDEEEIAELKTDWSAGCERLHRHAIARAKELARVARVHRDPFEPILAVLEADSPVGEYRKIADEVLRFAPSARRHSKAGAETVRSFLLIRFGLHLGFRQKNLRQLLYCPRGQTPRTERQLSDLKRGELRWNEKEQGWEVFCPARAFKNADSSFFRGRPFRLVLPDLGRLYEHIEAWIDNHRAILLAGAEDPGTFFIKTVKRTSTDAAYCQNTFYEAWRWVIQRYGIYNPYTGRGAIPGLLPHGPHNVRDVLATHILKHTGSYEQASYAIQDTPDMVAQHYGRFLPQDKAALAAEVLNRAWEAA